MSAIFDRSADGAPNVYATVREEIHRAFDHVALSMSCTLPMLLAATRARGIKDEDVLSVLTLDELSAADGEESDMHLHCYRSGAGVLYITRDTAAPNRRARVYEGFARLWRSHVPVDAPH